MPDARGQRLCVGCAWVGLGWVGLGKVRWRGTKSVRSAVCHENAECRTQNAECRGEEKGREKRNVECVRVTCVSRTKSLQVRRGLCLDCCTVYRIGYSGWLGNRPEKRHVMQQGQQEGRWITLQVPSRRRRVGGSHVELGWKWQWLGVRTIPNLRHQFFIYLFFSNSVFLELGLQRQQ